MIQYRDLSYSKKEIRENIKSIKKILKSGKIIDGVEIQELEKKVALYCWREYAIAVNSGTTAIILALQVLDIKRGDEIIVPCIGVVPVVNPILMLGAKPIFVDVGIDYNINPELIEDKITNKTKAILAIDCSGKVCDYYKIMDIAKKYNIKVIEDCSQAFGAKYKDGVAGKFGDISVMSMNAMKILGTAGESGMILTNDEYTCKKLKNMRYNGLIDKVRSNYISLNYRMNTIQAAILLNKMRHIDAEIEKRRQIVKLYDKLLRNLCNTCEENYPSEIITYFTYNVRVKDRDGLYKFLTDNGIETQMRDSVLLPHQLPNREEYKDLKFPIGDEIAKTSISLPLHNKLKVKDIKYICRKIEEYGK